MNLTTRRRTSSTSLVLIVSLLFTTAPAQAAQPNSPEPVDLQMVTRIRQEGFRNSKVMELAQELTDVYGQRLTGSSSLKRSQQWAQQQMEQWGLKNAAQVPYDFGRGWQLDDFRIRMVAPDVMPLLAYPKAWTPATNGVIRGQVVKARLTTSAELEKYRGQLAGKIVITGDLREIKPGDKAALSRYSDEQLAEVFQYEIPRSRPSDRDAYQRLREFRRTLNQFLVDEKVLAVIDASRGDAGLIYVQGGGSHRPTEPVGPPSLVMDVSSYGRISRLLDKKIPVELELEIKSRFLDEDQNALNTVAEIPGADKAGEVVIAGAHIDSWHGSTGATDNAAGVAVVMEAARILQALGVKPRRTIRVALWTGEEQGLLGARAYVAQRYAERAPAAQGQSAERAEQRPLQLKPEHAAVAAYFNYDNGTGKVRGMFTEENSAVVPIFQAWLEPFADLGATIVSNRRNPGSDHQAFDEVGIPGFQFLQDDIEYDTRTHHSMADSFERLQREDLMQAAVIMASFLYHAAMRDEMLPRKPLPKEAVPVPEPAKTVEKKPAGKKR